MDDRIYNTVEIDINIKWDPEMRHYTWKYGGPVGLDPATGNFKLSGHGRTSITYKLDDECTGSYQLIYVNLDPEICATHQIEHIHVQRQKNSITIIDRNDLGNTGTNPFSLRLVARMTDNISSGFISSDPQVTNDPNTERPPPK